MKRLEKRQAITDKEKKYLDDFAAGKRRANKLIAFSEMKSLAAKMAEGQGRVRDETTVWRHLQKIAGDLLNRKNPGRRETSATKILKKLKLIMKLVDKPSEYLQPLEDLVVENARLVGIIRRAGLAVKRSRTAMSDMESLLAEAQRHLRI